MALRIVGRLKTTVAIGPSCCTSRSALGLTVVQCSRGMHVPALAQAARGWYAVTRSICILSSKISAARMNSQRMSRRGRSLATSGKMSSDSPDTATVSSRMKRPRAGMAPMTSPPTMKTFAVLAGCRPKISTISSRLTQMPRYLPMRSMAGSFDDAPPAAGGASVLSGCFVLRLLSRRLSRLLATLLGALPRGDRDLLGVPALGALGEANGEDAVVVRRLRPVGVDAVGKRDLAIEPDVALDPRVLALFLGLGLAADGQRVVFQLDLHLIGLDPRQLGGQLDGVVVVAHLHAGHADHAAIALGSAGGEHGVQQRRAEEIALHALEQRVQHRERILVLPRRQAALAAVAGFRHRGRLALVLTLALLVRHGRLLSVIRRWRVRPVDPSTSYRDQYRSPPVSHGPEEVAHRPTDGTSRRSATASRYHPAGARSGPCRARAERRARRAAQALRVVDAWRGGGDAARRRRPAEQADDEEAQRVWWRWEELNLRHGAYETPALPLSYTAEPRKINGLETGFYPGTPGCARDCARRRGHVGDRRDPARRVLEVRLADDVVAVEHRPRLVA